MQPLDLGLLPTPLLRLGRILGAEARSDLWIKRDDLIGVGDGGNKIRKLRHLLAAARAQGCGCVITAGAEQSNHCRQTAAAAALCGIPCHLALGGHEPGLRTANLLLSTIFGAVIHWCGEDRKREQLPRIADRLRSQGMRPYVIPYGGSDAVGTRGFHEAALELRSQCAEQGLAFDHVFIASSSGATQAGLLAGWNDWPEAPRVHGVRVDPTQSEDDLRRIVLRLGNACLPPGSVPLPPESVLLDDWGIEDDYAECSTAIAETLRRLARSEGILVDPVYTGRALRACLQRIEDGTIPDGSRVLFWHTGGTTALHAFAGAFEN